MAQTLRTGGDHLSVLSPLLEALRQREVLQRQLDAVLRRQAGRAQ
jgi:hypothetical protein